MDFIDYSNFEALLIQRYVHNRDEPDAYDALELCADMSEALIAVHDIEVDLMDSLNTQESCQWED